MSIQFVRHCVFASAALLAALVSTGSDLWAQSGLQITIGSGRAGPFGGVPFGVGPTGPGPFGVYPTIPFGPRGLALASPYYSGSRPYGYSGYNRYSGYSGYDRYVPYAPPVSVYGYAPTPRARANSSYDYPYSGTGPYSGYSGSARGGINISPGYNNYSSDYYQSQSAIRPQTGNSYRSPVVSPNTPDLRPGMVLPDGATVISVGQPREIRSTPNSTSPQAANEIPAPNPTPTKSGRISF